MNRRLAQGFSADRVPERTDAVEAVVALALWVARGGHRGLAIELKASRGKPTLEQLEWLGHMGGMGWIAVLCVGFDAARQTIDDYLA